MFETSQRIGMKLGTGAFIKSYRSYLNLVIICRTQHLLSTNLKFHFINFHKTRLIVEKNYTELYMPLIYITTFVLKPTTAAQVRSRVRSCGFCSEQSGTGAGSFRVLRFPLPILISPTPIYSFIILRSKLHRLHTDNVVK
jgi:hypothetical protein